MIRRWLILAGLGCAGLWVTTWGHSQEPETISTFMRAKLLHSQKVIEGLTTENLELVAKHSQAISLLSQESNWQVLQTPEYLQRSGEFRRTVDDMTKAARQRNLDGATLAFVGAMMKCVDCHKYVRSVRMAQP